MFDLQDEKTTRHHAQGPDGQSMVGEPEKEEAPAHALDSERNKALHRRLMGLYRAEMQRQETNRLEQSIDADYYDHIQWTEEEKAALRDRGQAPIVYNVLGQTINWVIGSEKRGRTDYKVQPRGKEDAKPAERKSKYMKYLSDVNRSPFHRSRAFEDTVKVGIGWLESYINDMDDDEQIRFRYESWRNMLWDSAGTELDCSDWRYIARAKWVDEDIAVMLASDREACIKRAVTDSATYGSYDNANGDGPMDSQEQSMDEMSIMGAGDMFRRRRVRLIEFWYRAPVNVQVMRGGMFNGEEYDPEHEGHAAEKAGNTTTIVSKGKMVMRVALMTENDMLYDGPTPFKHNKFKFVPVWGYRRDKDGLPYGIIRGIRPIQDAVNKRASKALHILSTNKVVMEDGALPDGMTIDEFADEVSRPDGIITYRKGYKIDLNADRQLGAEHMNQMSVDIGMIQQVGGVTDELLGRSTNAVSGIAVEKRQEQGSVATNKLFDNLRLAVQMVGEIELSLIEQYATEAKQFRVTNMRGSPEFITVNDGLPENDITRSKADFVISEADWRATMRQAQTEQLTELMMKLPPEVVVQMLDLVVDSMDIENRDEIVKRLRKMSGQRDPDATEPTPEEQEAAQAQAAAQQLQQQQVELAMRDQEATIGKTLAEADRIKAETNRVNKLAISASMLAANDAMTAATLAIASPTVATVGDALLNQAGWKGAHAANIAAAGLPPMPPPAPPPQPMPDPGQPPQGAIA
jgi:hypothetical protein